MDPRVHQELDRGFHVRLVGADTRAVKRVPHPEEALRRGELHPERALPVHRAPVLDGEGDVGRVVAQDVAGRAKVRLAHAEERPEPALDDGEGFTRGEPAEDVNLGSPADRPLSRLDDESLLPLACHRSHCTTGRGADCRGG